MDGVVDGVSDAETDGVKDGKELGMSLGANGTWDPPPHTQHALTTFLPSYHLSFNVSQKDAVTLSHVESGLIVSQI